MVLRLDVGYTNDGSPSGGRIYYNTNDGSPSRSRTLTMVHRHKGLTLTMVHCLEVGYLQWFTV